MIYSNPTIKCCYYVQVLMLECCSCLPEQGLRWPRDKNSGLPKPERSQLSPKSPHPGGSTFNCKHHIMCFMAPNTRPNTSQQERRGVSVKTIGGEFVIYGRGSSQRSTEIYCTWSATRRPLLSYNPPSKEH
jgi:hypothetical protein